jgi:LuxR family transcriptional regulator, maltose regulon positive regulatory protein
MEFPAAPLATKLIVPPVRPALVSRPHLDIRLAQALHAPLTLISAPAGFGKTTLASAWAHHLAAGSPEPEGQLRVAWLSLGDDDNHPAAFLAYLLEALQRGWPGMAAGVRPLLATPQPPLPVILTALINDLEVARQPGVLVLDDYHVLTSPAIHEAVTYLVEHLPAALHLILITRADPPLPLARWRARNRLIEIRAPDLRFTLGEAAAFLNEAMRLGLAPDQVGVLAARTEGWIAGLQLAALSLQRSTDPSRFIAEFAGSQRFVLDYLADEVLASQPEAIQAFLLQTSILERLTGPLCDALLPDDRPPASAGPSSVMLEEVERANLFLVPLDEARQWYRYHHLFAEFLRHRLMQAPRVAVAELHLRASGWYARSGMSAEAVHHALAAGDVNRASELLEQHANTRWASAEIAFLDLIKQLPADFVRRRPRLRLYQAWMNLMRGEVEPALAALDDVDAHRDSVEEPEASAMRAFAGLMRAYLNVLADRDAPVVVPGPEALEYVPEQNLAVRNSADVVYAFLCQMNGQLDRAGNFLAQAAARDRAAGGFTAIPIATSRLARLRLEQGRLHDAARLCRESLAVVDAVSPWRHYAAGSLNAVLGDVLREWNDLNGALAQVDAGVRRNQPWGIPGALVLAHCAQARVLLARGDLVGAEQAVQAAAGCMHGRTLQPDLNSDWNAIRVALWLRQGNLDAASDWAHAHTLAPDATLSYRMELDALALARVLLAEGQPRGASSLLDRLAVHAQAGGRTGRLVEIHVLRALACQAAGKADQALAALAAGLRLGQAQGYQRVFLEAGEPMGALLQRAVTQGIAVDQARQLLEAMQAGAPSKAVPAEAGVSLPATLAPAPAGQRGLSVDRAPADQGALLEPLSERELEILRLAAEGLTNQEIADRLVLAVGTVKRHTNNIFGKLGVRNRTQAARRARDLGLL